MLARRGMHEIGVSGAVGGLDLDLGLSRLRGVGHVGRANVTLAPNVSAPNSLRERPFVRKVYSIMSLKDFSSHISASGIAERCGV